MTEANREFKPYICGEWSPAWSGKRCVAVEVHENIGESFTLAGLRGYQVPDADLLADRKVRIGFRDDVLRRYQEETVNLGDFLVITHGMGTRECHSWPATTFPRAWHRLAA